MDEFRGLACSEMELPVPDAPAAFSLCEDNVCTGRTFDVRSDDDDVFVSGIRLFRGLREFYDLELEFTDGTIQNARDSLSPSGAARASLN